MQTLQFTRALREIVKELKVDELLEVLNKWLLGQNAQVPQGDKDRFAALIFDSHSGCDRLVSDDPCARAILQGLNLRELYEPARLTRLLNRVHSSPQTDNIRQNNPEIYDFFETLKALQRLSATCLALLEVQKVGAEDPAKPVLELELIDYDGMGIEPARLQKFVSVLSRLYAHLARVLGVEENTFRFKYFDSGSPLLVGIQGSKEVIEALSTLLHEWWEKIRFWKYDRFDKEMDAVCKGLSVMTKVKEAVDNHVMDAETGANMSRRICHEIYDLTGLGATLPLKDATEVDQRQLLVEKRDTKLLGSGIPEETDEEADEEDRSDRGTGRLIRPPD
jgi:hypothetical protein